MLSGNLQILCQKFEKIKEVASPKWPYTHWIKKKLPANKSKKYLQE